MSSTDPLAQAQANPASAEKTYNQILAEDSSTADAQLLRDKETALIKLGELYRNQKNAKALAEVIALSPCLLLYNKVRTLLDLFSAITNSQETKMNALTDEIARAKAEKGVSSKSLETRLVGLQLESQQLQLTLTLIDNLLTELKHLDDKTILTEVYSVLRRVYCGIGNLPKAKVCLSLPLSLFLFLFHPDTLSVCQSGILHAEDKDYTTTYLYFFEAFENLSSQGDDGALGALK
ncbi:putative 26S proteasome regulatory subunit rpn6 [Leucoagaricus sp. SymC.cos]|nr:putative 26S proteasome regulatory subunit rpn6 [Leucoagaricus sp. SymC.cos]